MSALSDRLTEAKENRSIDAIAAQAGQRGHKIDRATVARYVAGDHGPKPPDRVLVALAEGLGIDVRELRELAGRPRGELGPYEPPAESSQLSLRQRKAVDHVIKAMVEPGVKGGGGGGTEEHQKISSAADGSTGGTESAAPPRRKGKTVGRGPRIAQQQDDNQR